MSCTETLYIESATTLEEKVVRYDAIILALENQMLNVGAGNSDVQNYSIDDGQVKISTQYRDVVQIAKAITSFTALRNAAVNKLNGRLFVLRPWRGLI